MRFILILLFLLLSVYSIGEIHHEDSLQDNSKDEITAKINNVRIPWVQNNGQLAQNIAYYAKTFAGSVYLKQEGSLLYNLMVDSIRSSAFTEQFLNNNVIDLNAGEPSITKVNYFKGNNPDKWLSNVSTFQTINLKNVWSGIDIELNAHGNNIEKLFHIKPGSDPKDIQIEIDGAKSVEISNTGELIVSTIHGESNFTKPIAYQEINGEKEFCAVEYCIKNTTYGFIVDDYNKEFPLIIDPLIASTFIGGSSNEVAYDIVLDYLGNVLVTGFTYSSDFPCSANAYDSLKTGFRDVFISKFDPLLTTLLGSTYIGGEGDVGYSEIGRCISFDQNNNILISGQTGSSTFPTTPGVFDQTINGVNDVFISIFNSEIDSLLASTFIGGSSNEDCYSITVNEFGEIYITGTTRSVDFPVTPGAYDVSLNGQNTYDIFISKIDGNLTNIISSTF